MRVRRYLQLGIASILLSGCATYKYTAPNGESITITRGLTDDKFDTVTAEGPGRKLTVTGYTSEQVKALEEIKTILQLLVEGAAKGAKP